MKGQELFENPREFKFYPPVFDKSGQVEFMRYCNNRLSYGINTQTKKFMLCLSPLMSAEIIKIIGTFDTYDEMREAYYVERDAMN